MATAQKKTGGKRQASRSASSKGSTSGGTRGGKRTASYGRNAVSSGNRKKNPKPIRREVGAVICLILAVFAALGYFRLNGIFINFFCHLLEGLTGYGFYLAPVMLLLASYILAFHRGRPVRLRVWCALLLPVALGAVLHLFLAKGTYAFDGTLLPALWNDGIALVSGGVVS